MKPKRMSGNNPSNHVALITFIILAAALSRLLPHPPNFTALGAMALFGGAYLKRKWLAVLIPLAALFVSDLLLNNFVYGSYQSGFTLFTQGALWIYLGFVLIVGVAWLNLKKVNTSKLIGSSFFGFIGLFSFEQFWRVDDEYDVS